jgi:putative transposase
MGLPKSTFYDAPATSIDETELVTRMQAIRDEFETYSYRRVSVGLSRARI